MESAAKRNFVEVVETGSSADDRGRNKEPKLSLDTETKQEPPPTSKWKSMTEMDDRELLESLDEYEDGEEISKETLQKLREYISQKRDSEGFEIDVWPGAFYGVTDLIPVVLSKEHDPEGYAVHARLAKFAMDEHNKNHQTGFEFEELQRVNVYPVRQIIYYLTFTARDGCGGDQNATHKTFQAQVVSGWADDKDMYLDFCRPKLNA